MTLMNLSRALGVFSIRPPLISARAEPNKTAMVSGSSTLTTSVWRRRQYKISDTSMDRGPNSLPETTVPLESVHVHSADAAVHAGSIAHDASGEARVAAQNSFRDCQTLALQAYPSCGSRALSFRCRTPGAMWSETLEDYSRTLRG